MEIDYKRELIKIIRGSRNGFYYGAKVRVMHSLVIMILFGKGSWKIRLKKIIENTITHGGKLALFVFLFKSILFVLKVARKKEEAWHSFVGGCIGGYIICKNGENQINQQLILYLLSRIIFGVIKYFQKRGYFEKINFFKILGFFSWAFVMLLFNDNHHCLQHSLSASMKFLYIESEKWKNWKDFVPFYLP
jgi:peroxisomal membrane protein 4